MKTEAEIIAKHVDRHTELEWLYYTLESISKEEFDLEHGQNWDEMREELIEEGYITVGVPSRNLEAEIDILKQRIVDLERG